jgi:hypothetical protein
VLEGDTGFASRRVPRALEGIIARRSLRTSGPGNLNPAILSTKPVLEWLALFGLDEDLALSA